MKPFLRSALYVLLASIFGCGPVSVSGTVSLAPGYMAIAPSTCSDIEISASNRFLDSATELATTRATGDISTGHCSFQLAGVPTGGSVFVGSPPYREAYLYYSSQPEGGYTLINDQFVDVTFPFPIKVDLTMNPPESRPPL